MIIRTFLIALLACGARAETHRFAPTEFHNTFSFAHKPVLRIKPGDRVVTKTIDARGFDEKGTKVGEPSNPQTGPFYVEGAERGDALVVRILKLETNRATGWSSSILAPYTATPGFLRFEGLREQKTMTWQIDSKRGVTFVESAEFKPGRIELPLRPMLGCIGTAPDRKAAIPTSTPGAFGGNMDYNGMNAGVTLTLPVYELGALLFVGDAHARQGDGEVLGNAVETSMDVEFSVELVKKKAIDWPRLENADYIMVLGSARPLLEALQLATTELQGWLIDEYGFDERGASMLMGQAMEFEIANVVDPAFTVAAKMRKSYLVRR